MLKLAAITLGLLASLAAMSAGAVAVKVRTDSIEGRVFNSANDRGVAGLSVRLIAPKAMRQPVKITVTNADGQFSFRELTAGKYLLTIYQGTTLLYRKEIDNRVAQDFTVPLRSVPVAQ